MIDRKLLSSLALFYDSPRPAIDALASVGRLLRLGPETLVFREGEQPKGWYIVVEGHVRVVRGSGARQHVVHTEGPGGTLGEVPLFADGTYPASAITSEPTVLAFFGNAALRGAMVQAPGVSLLLLRLLALRVRRLVTRLDERSARTVQSRLAEFLVQRYRATPSGMSVSLRMTQQRLAEELGTVREVVSRELQKLRRDGVIEVVGGGRYRILRIEALARGE
jgi:CRP/FNR family transcriptional regulator